MEGHIVVFKYTGRELYPGELNTLKNMIESYAANIDTVTAYVLTEDELIKTAAACIVTSRENALEEHADSEKSSDQYAAEQAMAFIGKIFEKEISQLKTVNTPFIVGLATSITKGSTALESALEILSTKNYKIPQSIIRKYHITTKVIDIVKQVYNQYVNNNVS